MAEIKKISTELQLLDKFLDTSGDAGTSGQVLTSTGTGINWVSGGSLPGGPYLPLSAGSSYPLTGSLVANFQLFIKDGVNIPVTGGGTINAYSRTVSTNLFSALRVWENSGASSYWDIGATGGSSTLLNFYHNANITPRISFTHTGNLQLVGGKVQLQSQPTTQLEMFTNQLTLTAGGNQIFTGANGAQDSVTIGRDVGDTDIRLAGGSGTKFAFLEGSSGNFAIGTNSPSARLHLEGDAIVEGVIRADNFNLGLGGAIKVKASNNAVDQYVAFGTTPSSSTGLGNFYRKNAYHLRRQRRDWNR